MVLDKALRKVIKARPMYQSSTFKISFPFPIEGDQTNELVFHIRDIMKVHLIENADHYHLIVNAEAKSFTSFLKKNFPNTTVQIILSDYGHTAEFRIYKKKPKHWKEMELITDYHV